MLCMEDLQKVFSVYKSSLRPERPLIGPQYVEDLVALLCMEYIQKVFSV